MKKLFTRLSPIFLLLCGLILGGLVTFTPVSAIGNDRPAPSSDEDIDAFFGDSGEDTPQNSSQNPSNDPAREPISDDAIDAFFGTMNGVDRPDDEPKNPRDPISDEDIDNFFGDSEDPKNPQDPISDEDIDNFFGDTEDPDAPNNSTDGNNTNPDPGSDNVNVCQNESKGISWILCTAFEVGTGISDTVYNVIESFLVVEPLTTEPNSAVYRVWDCMRGLTNIVFVIFLIIVIYSQITGFGINNYGIKRVLPRLIVAIILVNLSYIICALLVDASNIIGNGISELFNNIITETGLNDVAQNQFLAVDWNQIFLALTAGGAALAIFTTTMGGPGAAFWAAVVLLIGVLFSALTGFITIGLRQVVVTLLVAIAPLAFVAYLLPNTEKWFEKWKSLLAQMIFFYPTFAILFSASKLGGLIIIGNSGGELLKVIVGLAVQVLPLFLSVSLLKMSGTILGKVSSALDKTFGHVSKPLQDWGALRAEQKRWRYIKSGGKTIAAPGAKLRNYLAKRQALREANIEDNKTDVLSQAATYASNKRASYKGTNRKGLSKWSYWANRYTRDAKDANTQHLIADTAKDRLASSLSDHGFLFHGRGATRRAALSANAFKQFTKQQFWKENIAQGDQEYLISEYLQAVDEAGVGNYRRYNNLIADASGSRGYKGDRTIIGQVVKRSVEIETRRRGEAAVVINKFGYNKEFRNMMFDRLRMNDDGFAVDAQGNVLEDEFYRPLNENAIEHWDKYILVDKNNREISREKYARLSPEKQQLYRKIRYCEIKNDKGFVVNKVFEDDAGYVKEMINNDMLIGDPIALRYATEIGLPRSAKDLAGDPLSAQFAGDNADRMGAVRAYRTTVVAALQASGFKEHMAEMTSMLLAQINAGHVNSPEQMNIARLISFAKSSKVGAFLQNDAFFYNFWAKVLPTINDEEAFAKYFPDSEIALYRDQNGKPLGGLRLGTDKDGNLEWQKISATSSDITLEDRKNYIKHKVLPEAITKIFGAVGRNISPNVLDSMKPENAKALRDILIALTPLGEQNVDPSIPFERRMNGTKDLFDNQDPNRFKDIINMAKERAEAIKSGIDPNTITRQQALLEDLSKRLRHTSPTAIAGDIDSILSDENITFDQACSLLDTYCKENRVLNKFDGVSDIIEKYRFSHLQGDNQQERARNFADNSDPREALAEELKNVFM